MCQAIKRKDSISKEFIINYQRKLDDDKIDWQGSECFIPTELCIAIGTEVKEAKMLYIMYLNYIIKYCIKNNWFNYDKAWIDYSEFESELKKILNISTKKISDYNKKLADNNYIDFFDDTKIYVNFPILTDEEMN